jgi:hypothetical protein
MSAYSRGFLVGIVTAGPLEYWKPSSSLSSLIWWLAVMGVTVYLLDRFIWRGEL